MLNDNIVTVMYGIGYSFPVIVFAFIALFGIALSVYGGRDDSLATPSKGWGIVFGIILILIGVSGAGAVLQYARRRKASKKVEGGRRANTARTAF